MSAIYEKNMVLLKERFPTVYEQVESFYSKNPSRSIHINLETTRNSLFNLKINKIFLHSNFDPEREASLLIQSQDLKASDTLIVLGFGAGYHIEKMIVEFPEKNKIIIEPDIDIFSYVIKNKDVRQVLSASNVEIILSNNVQDITNKLQLFYYFGNINVVSFIALNSYKHLYQELWDEIKLNHIKLLRTFSVNVQTMTIFKHVWVANFFHNLKHINQSADIVEFAGKFKSTPAIIVSSGPSLSKNISLLKDVGDKAIIIAAGSSISALQRNGIKPHIMLGIDGGSAMSEVYNTVEWTDILFAYTLNLHFESLDKYTGPKMYVKNLSEHQLNWMEEYTKHDTIGLESGGSCANVSLDFLMKLGCNPIIFVGQDLALTNLQSHADGILDKQVYKENEVEKNNLIKTTDIYGKEIYTAQNFITMAYTFENYFSRHAKDHIFVNATEGGLDIKGTKIMTLREAIDQYCNEELDLTAKIKEFYEISKKSNENLNDEIIKFVKMIMKHSEKLDNQSKKRGDLINKICANIKKGKLENISKQKKKLFELTDKLEKNDIFRKIIWPASRDILLVLKNSSENKAAQVSDTKEKLQILFEGLIKQYQIVYEKNKVIYMAANDSLIRLNGE